MDALELPPSATALSTGYAIRTELTSARSNRYWDGNCPRHRPAPWVQHPWGWNFGYICAGRIYGLGTIWVLR